MTTRHFLLQIILLLLLATPTTADPLTTTLDRFDSYAEQALRDWRVPGMAVAVVKGNHVVYSRGFGTKRVGANDPVTVDTVFQAGSVTKAFTVALVAQLVDQGVVGWDDPVTEHDPDFRMADPWVTKNFLIHDLFAQHSGLPGYVGDLQVLMGFDREHIIHSLRYFQPEYSFRDKFSYVNNLFLEGGHVAEIVTKRSWESLLHERIFTPLSMTSSSVSREGYEASPDRAVMHTMVNGSPMPILPGMVTFDWPYTFGPAGGLNSSVKDMVRWLTAHMHGGAYGPTRIFSAESAAYMHRPVVTMDFPGMSGAYCQGWVRLHLEKTDVIWHNGTTSGGKSFIGFSPKLGIGIVVLTNLGGHSLPDALAYQLFDMISGVEGSDWSRKFLPPEGGDRPAKEPAPTVSLTTPLQAYAGTYTDPVYGTMVVTPTDDGLSITLGAQGQFTLAARPVADHTFAGDWSSIMPEDPEYTFVFRMDDQGRSTAVSMPDLAAGGVGVFTRQ